MLDDLKLLHERDAQDALGIAERQWQQLEHLYDLPDMQNNYLNVVFAGMGGSALAATMAATWPRCIVPFETCRTYNIPVYVGPGTLFIASSYSGNTEETLAALEEADAKNAHIVVIAGGGKLAEIAGERGYPFAQLPPLPQPRFAALASLKALVVILQRAGLSVEADAEQTMHKTSIFLRESVKSWVATVPTAQNFAKQLALDIVGTSPVIYAGTLLYPAAYKWKISFNENAKNVAWAGAYPEFNHNEFIGWTSHPVDKPYTVIDLRSGLEHARIQKRFEVSDRLLSGKRPAAHVVNAEGSTVLEQLVWTTALGDFVSLYVALLNGLNPTPVDLIEKFKKSLDE